jgi:hypothetical protein
LTVMLRLIACRWLEARHLIVIKTFCLADPLPRRTLCCRSAIWSMHCLGQTAQREFEQAAEMQNLTFRRPGPNRYCKAGRRLVRANCDALTRCLLDRAHKRLLDRNSKASRNQGHQRAGRTRKRRCSALYPLGGRGSSALAPPFAELKAMIC